MKIRYILALFGCAGLAACGSNEEQIRAEERAKMLEEQLAEVRAEQQAAAESQSSPDGIPVAGAEPAPAEEAAPAAPPAPVAAPVARAPAPAPVAKSSTVRSSGDRMIGEYTAYIGDDDLYNSKGTRLSDPAAILRQDRANFHKFGLRQPGDSSDAFFGSVSNRAAMERMVRNGSISSEARRRLQNGGSTVVVQIYGSGRTARRVDVSVY